MNPGLIILILKIAVVAVTILLAGSLVALARGNYRLHGRINLAFFILTLSALIGLEVIVRLLSPEGMFEQYLERHNAKGNLATHLWFSMPAAALLVVMLFTGWRRHRYVHIALGVLFLALWIGTFVTGVFYLPH
jgi:uncharacterized membrane protein YozB (DUF420 family)